MQKLFIMMLLGWLAVVAEVSAGTGSEKPKEADFLELNDYLSEKLPETIDDQQELLDHISSNMDRLPAGAKSAAQFVLDLVQKLPNGCTNELLADLIVLEKSKLYPYGLTKIQRLTGPTWPKALRSCEDHIKAAYPKDKSPAGFIIFLRAFNNYLGPESPLNKHRTLDEYYLSSRLRKLAGQCRQLKRYERLLGKNRKVFDVTFDVVLVEPCKRVLSEDRLVENLTAIVLADSKDYVAAGKPWKFLVHIRDQLHNMLWMMDICTRVVNSGQSDKTLIYRTLSP